MNLNGLRVAVTRPLEQSARLAAAIDAGGGESFVFPLIEIGPPPDPAALDALIDRLDAFDWAIFSSPTAVDRAIECIRARRALPAGWSIAAIGEGTQRALARHGFDHVLAPTERFDSEALLALPALADLQGRQAVIFRGQEGRELMAEGLRARGVRGGQLDALVVTSSEAVHNLCEMLSRAGSRPSTLAGCTLFVPHPRIAAAARSAGFGPVVESAGGDSGVLDALAAFAARQASAAGTGALHAAGAGTSHAAGARGEAR
ncbi:MAG: uroporphyrinogen-III synthase [Proteobacteria bacterium]|nr:uroporphyrinogen-III synthase [Pseudomonadota bacterium]